MTFDESQKAFEETVAALLHELQQIRTGRATPALVESVSVDAYEGTRMTVQQLSSITIPDARTIQIEPWDVSVVKAIEKGIRTAQPNLNPMVDGKTIRVPMPELTEESRHELVKRIGQKVEEAKQRAWRIRGDVRSAILDAERENAITEDDRFRLQKQLDERTEHITDQLKSMGDRKSKEVMTL